ncbi:MAG: YjgN family protein [Pseudomonadota bacterium]
MSNQSRPEQTFEFRGTAREWFGIWIVNLLLSIITVGIYSAWAKVRRLKYFYNNTYMDGRNFNYHATGKQILIGRLIFIAGYIVFSLAISLSPIVGGALAIALLVVIPWLVVRAMKFNARMTSFSNVRFDFEGTVGKAAVVFILAPILAYALIFGLAFAAIRIMANGNLGGGVAVLIAAGLVLPLAFAVYDRLLKLFSINNHLLGSAGFSLRISLGPFLVGQFVALAWILAVGGIGVSVTGFSFAAFEQAIAGLENGDSEPGDLGVIGLFYFLVFAAFIPAGFIYQTIVRNAVYSRTTMDGGHSFRSDIHPARFFWIGVSNFAITVCSFGLLLPWTQIRMMRYLTAHTHVTPGGSLDDFIGEQVAAGNAVGDAFSDFEAVDVGLPI